MGFRSALTGQRIYLDTNIFIYALEARPEFVAMLTALFTAVDQGELHVVTSELTLAEVLVKPFLDKSVERQMAYEAALQNSLTRTTVPVSRAVLKEAARLRAVYRLRLPDAIHIATALLTHCDSFLTNDVRLRSVSNIKVLILSEDILA